MTKLLRLGLWHYLQQQSMSWLQQAKWLETPETASTFRIVCIIKFFTCSGWQTSSVSLGTMFSLLLSPQVRSDFYVNSWYECCSFELIANFLLPDPYLTSSDPDRQLRQSPCASASSSQQRLYNRSVQQTPLSTFTSSTYGASSSVTTKRCRFAGTAGSTILYIQLRIAKIAGKIFTGRLRRTKGHINEHQWLGKLSLSKAFVPTYSYHRRSHAPSPRSCPRPWLIRPCCPSFPPHAVILANPVQFSLKASPNECSSR